MILFPTFGVNLNFRMERPSGVGLSHPSTASRGSPPGRPHSAACSLPLVQHGPMFFLQDGVSMLTDINVVHHFSLKLPAPTLARAFRTDALPVLRSLAADHIRPTLQAVLRRELLAEQLSADHRAEQVERILRANPSTGRRLVSELGLTLDSFVPRFRDVERCLDFVFGLAVAERAVAERAVAERAVAERAQGAEEAVAERPVAAPRVLYEGREEWTEFAESSGGAGGTADLARRFDRACGELLGISRMAEEAAKALNQHRQTVEGHVLRAVRSGGKNSAPRSMKGVGSSKGDQSNSGKATGATVSSPDEAVNKLAACVRAASSRVQRALGFTGEPAAACVAAVMRQDERATSSFSNPRFSSTSAVDEDDGASSVGGLGSARSNSGDEGSVGGLGSARSNSCRNWSVLQFHVYVPPR